MNKLEAELASLKTDFKPFFHTRLKAAMENEIAMSAWPRLTYVIYPSLIIIFLLIGAVYFQDGIISYDSLLGLADYEYDSITEQLEFL